MDSESESHLSNHVDLAGLEEVL